MAALAATPGLAQSRTINVGDAVIHYEVAGEGTLIPNAGHGAHFARPVEFNASMLRFLDEAERNKRLEHGDR